MKKFTLLITLFFMASSQALELYSEEKGELVSEYFAYTTSLLPNSVREELGRIEVRFENLQAKRAGMLGLVKKKILQRKKKISLIRLDKEILEMLKAPSVETMSPHGDNRKRTAAILLHEIMHIYDYQNLFLPTEKAMQETCQNDRENGSLSRKERRACRRLLKKNYTISDSRLFLNLAGWNALGLIKKKDKQLNRNMERSPDPYEYENAQEFLGVNFEFFLLDPEYKCRRPNLYSYFKENLEHTPFTKVDCSTSSKIIMTTDIMKGEGTSIVDLDPKRVYEVHYLFAGQGKAIMSRWGHAMVRLVICAPQRERPSKECLKDIAYHRVLSFRANITGTSMDYAKGLNGGYDSMMFLMHMKDVVQEYTQGEFRDIFSLPLRLDEEQKEKMLKIILGQYWTYRGGYYFVSNNCANETLKLIRLGYEDDLYAQGMTALTPLQIFNRLKETDLVNNEALSDLSEAAKSGHYFPGAHKRLEENFELLKMSGHEFHQKRYTEFLEQSTTEQREELLEHISSQEKSVLKRKQLASIFKIEDFLLEKRKLELVSKLSAYINEKKRSNELDPEITDYLEKYERVQVELLPENIIGNEGYGIPLKSELDFGDEQRAYQYLKSQIKDIGATLIEWAEGSHPNDLSELKKIQELKVKALKELKKSI